jgi:hypothetical protein
MVTSPSICRNAQPVRCVFVTPLDDITFVLGLFDRGGVWGYLAAFSIANRPISENDNWAVIPAAPVSDQTRDFLAASKAPKTIRPTAATYATSRHGAKPM